MSYHTQTDHLRREHLWEALACPCGCGHLSPAAAMDLITVLADIGPVGVKHPASIRPGMASVELQFYVTQAEPRHFSGEADDLSENA